MLSIIRSCPVREKSGYHTHFYAIAIERVKHKPGKQLLADLLWIDLDKEQDLLALRRKCCHL